jgi:hypothetical protein
MGRNYVSDNMKHRSELVECPGIDDRMLRHFGLLCEDCDAKRISTLNLGDVESLYRAGACTQDHFEAYMYCWALLSPARSLPDWRTTPTDANVRRIARKLLRLRNFAVPKELED